MIFFELNSVRSVIECNQMLDESFSWDEDTKTYYGNNVEYQFICHELNGIIVVDSIIASLVDEEGERKGAEFFTESFDTIEELLNYIFNDYNILEAIREQ